MGCVYENSPEEIESLEARILELENQISEATLSVTSDPAELPLIPSSPHASEESEHDQLVTLIQPGHPAAFFDTSVLLSTLQSWDVNAPLPTSILLQL